jgi:hypothetical protein
MTMSASEETNDAIIGKSVEFKLPGQRFATPAPANGDRVFYESLMEQNPDSAMAQEWCVAYGALDEKKALALLAIIEKRKGASVLSPKRPTPVKASRPAPAAKKPPAKKAASKKK